MKKILILSLAVIICYSSIGITNEDIKEIYVIYDRSWTQFVGEDKYDRWAQYTRKDRDFSESIILPTLDFVIKYSLKPGGVTRKVYRDSKDKKVREILGDYSRYWFIGKFLIDKEKNISFIPVIPLNKKKYKKDRRDMEDIEYICERVDSHWKETKKYYEYNPAAGYGIYYDVEKGEFLPLSKEHPKYEYYFLFSLGYQLPQYLVIKPEYGKKLMEGRIIEINPNELKDNVVWQDWYNYWGLTDYKIEIP